MTTTRPVRSTHSTDQGELFGGFDSVADGIGKRIAEGILGRISSFPEHKTQSRAQRTATT
jgi:hypothetical protein